MNYIKKQKFLLVSTANRKGEGRTGTVMCPYGLLVMKPCDSLLLVSELPIFILRSFLFRSSPHLLTGPDSETFGNFEKQHTSILNRPIWGSADAFIYFFFQPFYHHCLFILMYEDTEQAFVAYNCLCGAQSSICPKASVYKPDKSDRRVSKYME